jgi:hypothetical protein
MRRREFITIRVPVTPAVLPGGIHKTLDLSFDQVLAGPQVGIGTPRWSNCSFFGGRRD